MRALMMAMVVIASVCLLWRRRYPVGVHLLITCCIAVTLLGPMGQGMVAVLVSLYTLGRHAADDQVSLLAMLLFLGVLSISVFWIGSGGFAGLFQLMVALAIWYIGRRLRFRHRYLRVLEERARALDARRHLEAEQAVTEERSRIARELHDIVAHQLSLMTVQAGAAKVVARSDIDAAIESMTAVEHAGRQALSEMRHLLNVLRTDQQDPELTPQPGSADIEKLVASVAAAGLDVELKMSGEFAGMPSRVDLTLYRLVQEALTNVLKHAGDGVAASVVLEAGEQGIELVVRDNGRGSHETTRRGYGIVGMRERVSSLGGWMTAEPKSQGGFEVRAYLPLRESAG